METGGKGEAEYSESALESYSNVSSRPLIILFSGNKQEERRHVFCVYMLVHAKYA